MSGTILLAVAALFFLARKRAPGPAKTLTVTDRLQAQRLTGFAVSAPTYQKLNVPSLESIRYGVAAGKAALGGGVTGGRGGSFGGGGGKQTVAP